MSITQGMARPPSASRDLIASDAPGILPLLDAHPSLLIYTRSCPYFEPLREVHNTAVTIQPLVIVRPRTEAGIVATVRFCSANHIPLSVRAGGHDIWGRSLVADGLVLDMRAFDTIEVNKTQLLARIGGGVLAGALAKKLDADNLCTPTGFCNTVGYVGWATGGGYGVMEGNYGFGVDQILGARLVLASGEVVDTDDDAELLWALRGAGTGNFGVVTEMRIRVYPRPRTLAGLLVFPLAEVGRVFAGFEELCETDFPDRFSGDFMVARVPTVGPAVAFLFSWMAEDDRDLVAAQAYLQRLCGLGTVLLNTVAETTPIAFSTALEPMTAVPQPFYMRSRNVARISRELGAILAAHPPPLDHCSIIIHTAHGACVSPNAAACFANRTPHVVLGIAGALPPGTPASGPGMDTVTRWADTVATLISEHGLAQERLYLSFTGPEERVDTTAFFGKDTTERLRQLKRKYDSGNLFACAYADLLG